MPYPDFESGKLDVYGAKLDEALPHVTIPLYGEESIVLDLQQAYNDAYRRVRYYAQQVDYSALPANFGAYSAEDQAKIKAFIEQISEES